MARTARVALVAIALAGATSASASAATFFVSTTGNNGNDCTSSGTPCLTITGAIAKARQSADTASTINIGAGTFNENVALSMTPDGGTDLVGAGSGAGGTTIQGQNGAAALFLGSQSTGNDVSHLKVVNSAGGTDNAVEAQTDASLTDVAIAVNNGGMTGLAASFRPVVFDSGSVTMAGGTTGSAVGGSFG